MRYVVYTESFLVGWGGYEPPEYDAFMWEGEARNRSEARRLAKAQWLKDNGRDFFGLKITVEGFEDCPEHGAGCENANFRGPECGTWRFDGHFVDGSFSVDLSVVPSTPEGKSGQDST